MDVYHKILIKLYEKTGGKYSKKVDLIDLVKKEGFYPSYKDIYSELHKSGWITETSRPDTITITHWGVQEARKYQTSDPDAQKAVKKEANRLRSEVKEFLVMTEELVEDVSEDNFKQVQKKFEIVKKLLDNLKGKI